MLGYREEYSDAYRRNDWDYRQSAWYFITICTDRRLAYFGEVREGRVGLTPAGCVAAHYWQKIAELNEHAVLDAFVVMPNHVHGLLGLLPDGGPEEPDPSPQGKGVAAEASLDPNDASPRPSCSTTERSTDCNRPPDEHMSRISPEPGSVSTILRSYKAAVTKRVRGSIRPDFGWQRGFHDHIVRSKQDFRRVRQYIQKNPTQWKRDPNHPDRLDS